MKWVAKEAKCGIGTMYNYFSSKEELYLLLMSEAVVKFTESLKKTKLFIRAGLV